VTYGAIANGDGVDDTAKPTALLRLEELGQLQASPGHIRSGGLPPVEEDFGHSTTLAEVQTLIDTQVQESLHLDYKDSRALGLDKASEIAKGVSAFANLHMGVVKHYCATALIVVSETRVFEI
jgi:hypothetical protein